MDAENLAASVMGEAALPDATMLDSMDDLFGEAAHGLATAMPTPPAPASLVLRLAEMQSRGCCTKLAWSSTGSIARISPNGSRITFHAMLRREKNGAWTSSRETDHFIEAPDGRTFVHVQFTGLGLDLAAADSLGNVHMYTLSSVLGRMHRAQGDASIENHATNELDSLVGMHWLSLFPSEFRGPYLDVAHKNGDVWEALLKNRNPPGLLKAHHPQENCHALFCINRSARLTLMYQNDLNRSWQSTSLALDAVTSSHQLLSHADLGEDGTDLLVATHDYASRLRIYRVSIDWHATSAARGPSMSVISVAPTLSSTHLTAVERVRAQQADTARLTHLRIIPAVPPFVQDIPTLPMVMAVFVHASLPSDANQQPPFSVIARWRIESLAPSLHASFGRLRNGSAPRVVTNNITVLRRQPDVMSNKVILSVQRQAFDTLIALGASDGGVELRDRDSLEPFMPSYGDPTTVANLIQSGFEHLRGEHHLHISLSPDASCVAFVPAHLGRDPDPTEAQPMILSHGWQPLNDGISDNQLYIEAAAVCVARQYASLCFHFMSSDEVLNLVPFDANVDTRALVLKNIFRMMNRMPDIGLLDYPKQQAYVIREPFVPRILAAQLALGTHPISGERNFAAQFAFAVLNMRLVANAFAQAFGRQDQRPSSDTASSLRGLASWAVDLFIFLIDMLYAIRRETASGSPPRLVVRRLVESGNPAAHLLLCSFSRALIRFLTLWVGKYFTTLQLIVPRATSVAERQDLMEAFKMPGRMPFKLSQFESLIKDFDEAVRHAYRTSQVGPERRGAMEVDMIVDGVLPHELEGPLDALLDKMLTKFGDGVDQKKLFFWTNTDWLGLTTSRPPAGATRYDVIRKTALTEGMVLRKCRRCGSEMEDVPQEKIKDLPQWFGLAQRYCVCMNYWILK